MNGSVIYEGLILQGGINVDTGANLEELTAYENGVYNPSTGKDGFSKVTVEVPAAVLDDITITENGHYTPPIGVDGYNDITVSVPHPAPVLDDITITENGSYQPPTGVDGYDNINVNVLPTLDNISITANGTYQPPTGVDGYDNIIVNVPAPAPVLDDITITENGTYTPPSGIDGYDEITVNVPLPSNGIYKQTLTGLPQPIATFTGADAPIDELIISIDAVQEGSGDPSPTNIRPISGWSSCDVTVTDDLTDPTVTRTVTISFGQDVYGGVLNVSTGELTITHAIVDLGTLTWSQTSSGYISAVSGLKRYPIPQVSTLVCDRYPTVRQDEITEPSTQFGISTLNWTDGVYLKDVTVTDATELATKLNGAQLVYELATPQTIQLTPTQVRTIQGNNNVFVDCGEVTECKYFSETP